MLLVTILSLKLTLAKKKAPGSRTIQFQIPLRIQKALLAIKRLQCRKGMKRSKWSKKIRHHARYQMLHHTRVTNQQYPESLKDKKPKMYLYPVQWSRWINQRIRNRRMTNLILALALVTCHKTENWQIKIHQSHQNQRKLRKKTWKSKL